MRFAERTSCILVALLSAAAFLASAANANTAVHLHGETMGTTYAVEVPAPPDGVTTRTLQVDVDAVLASIDREISTYRDDSELSRFNDSRSTEWFEVSLETSRVVAEALAISRLTEGTFDPTVGPLVDLWGFGARQRPCGTPSPEAVRAARAEVGFQWLSARPQPPALRKQRPALRVDLSALGNGLGVDRIAQRLNALGIRDYLVEIGGELRGRGRNARGKPWTVAVEEPGKPRDRALAVVQLEGLAISTSGSYRNYFEGGGARYSHVLDPRTGDPIRNDVVLVSVLAESAMRADALATALAVLGVDAGMRLARGHGMAVLFALREGDELRSMRTQEFAQQEVDLRRSE